MQTPETWKTPRRELAEVLQWIFPNTNQTIRTFDSKDARLKVWADPQEALRRLVVGPFFFLDGTLHEG